MRRIALLLILLFPVFTLAQNLVPNPSYELYNFCPSQLDNLADCAVWQNFGNTPDYFNTCGSNCLQAPDVCFGYQNPRSGNAYAGFITRYPLVNYREFLGMQLSNNLVVGNEYYLSFYVSNGGKSGAMLGTNKIGARFSTIPYSINNPPSLTNWAHIYTDSIIIDTLNWVQIKGSFVADSTYQYLVIGNFFDDTNTSYINYGLNNQQGYYFIDDVCLSTDSTLCYTLSDIKENNNIAFGFMISPNPVNDFIFLKSDFKAPFNVKVYNNLSQIVYSKKGNFGDLVIQTNTWGTGIYYFTLNNLKSSYSSKFIIKH
jgi:hypothetical protein